MHDHYHQLFTEATCQKLLPPSRTNEFFEALFGDAEEGSYDIELVYSGATTAALHFEILLRERPGHCLACNLTHGLPEVFSRHPVIDVSGIVERIDEMIGEELRTGQWSLDHTRQKSSALHAIPLTITLVAAS